MHMFKSSSSQKEIHHSQKLPVKSFCLSCQLYKREKTITFNICFQCSNQLLKPLYICEQCFNQFHQSQNNLIYEHQEQEKMQFSHKIYKKDQKNHQQNDDLNLKINESSNKNRSEEERINELSLKIGKLKNKIFKDVQKLINRKRLQEADVALKYFDSQIKAKLQKV